MEDNNDNPPVVVDQPAPLAEAQPPFPPTAESHPPAGPSFAGMQEELENLREEMRRMHRASKDSDVVGQLTAALKSLAPAEAPRPVYIAPSWQCERFADRPKSSGDPTAQEWVSDVRALLKSRRLPQSEEAISS